MSAKEWVELAVGALTIAGMVLGYFRLNVLNTVQLDVLRTMNAFKTETAAQLRKFEEDLDAKVQLSQQRWDLTLQTLRSEHAQRMSVIERDHVKRTAELEKLIYENKVEGLQDFVRRGSFSEAIGRVEAGIKDLGTQLNEDINALTKRVDDAIRAKIH